MCGSLVLQPTDVSEEHNQHEAGGKQNNKQLITWNRVFVEKLIVAQLVMEVPAFYVTRMFLTMFTGPATGSYPEPDETILRL
jgi:hypothetical protein